MIEQPLPADADQGWRALTDVVEEVVNPGQETIRWANREGLKGRSIEQVRAQAAPRGTRVHSVLTALLLGDEVVLERWPKELRGYASGVLNWQRRRDRKLQHTELPAQSTSMRVTARIDYLRECQRLDCECAGSGSALGDLKTGGLYPTVRAALQVIGGVVLAREDGLVERVCSAEVLCVNAQGDYQVHQVKVNEDRFRRAAAWHADLVQLRTEVREVG